MKVTPLNPDIDLAQSDLVRSPGLHMSAIYNDLFQDLEPKRFTRGSVPDRNRMGLGLALETVLEEGLKKRMFRPEEYLTDEGIAFSPDGLLFENGETILAELKLTWMSSREVPRLKNGSFPPKFDKYFVQIMAYCYHLELTRARLYVLFVNGISKPPTPELLAWDLLFTQRELDENWQRLLAHARYKGML